MRTFDDLRSLAGGVVDKALRGVNPAEAIHSWIYLLTLNIQVTFQDTITEWLCTQGIEVTGEFLANHVFSPPVFPLSTTPLPVGRCIVDNDRYAFAILRTVDLPEEEYKQKIVELESELNKLNIGSISPRLYPSAITFRYEVLRKQLQENGVEKLIEDLVNRMDERLRSGPSLKRGHQYLYTAQPDQAASNFEDTLRYAPNSWYALKHLAEARMLQGTEKTITTASEMPELFQRRQYLEEPWDEAIARFGQVRDLRLKGKDSNSSEAQEAYEDYYYLTGCTHLQAGHFDVAIEEFIMGRKHSPGNQNLAQVYIFALSLHRKEIERSMN